MVPCDQQWYYFKDLCNLGSDKCNLLVIYFQIYNSMFWLKSFIEHWFGISFYFNSVMKLFSNYSKQIKVKIGYACNIIKTWTVKPHISNRKYLNLPQFKWLITGNMHSKHRIDLEKDKKFWPHNRNNENLPRKDLTKSNLLLIEPVNKKNLRPINQNIFLITCTY